MDNKKLVILFSGLLFILLLFIIVGSLLFKFSPKQQTVITPTIVPFERKPFTGSTFNKTNSPNTTGTSQQKQQSIQTEVVKKSEIMQINQTFLDASLPVQHETFELYKDTLDGDKIKVLIKDQEKGMSDARAYINEHFSSGTTSSVPIEFVTLAIVKNNANNNSTVSQVIPTAELKSATTNPLQPTGTTPLVITPQQNSVTKTNEETSSYIGGLLNVYIDQQKAQKQTSTSTNSKTSKPVTSTKSTSQNAAKPFITSIPPRSSSDNTNALVNVLKTLFQTIDKTNEEAAKQALKPTNTPVPNTGSGAVDPDITPIPNLPPIASTIFSDYGLPQPVAEGNSGYNNLLNRMSANPSMKWSVEKVLEGERIYEAKGGKIYRYLTTMWVWTENGGSGWPDPYEINCNDKTHDIATVCPKTYVTKSGRVANSLLQIGGYQAFDHRNEFPEIFTMCHPTESVSSVLQQVLANSKNASKSEYNYDNYQSLVSQYNSAVQNATIQDISPNQSIYEAKTQFLTTLLGKDPCIVAVMNAKAVYGDNIPGILKGTKTVSWASYMLNVPYKQLMSNIIAALIITERGRLP